MKGRALPWVTVAFASGICAGDGLGPWNTAAAIVPVLGIALWAWRVKRTGALVFILALAAGLVRPFLVPLETVELPSTRTTLVGRVSSHVAAGSGSLVVIQAESPIRGGVRLRILEGMPRVLPGDRVAVDVRLRQPRSYRNPGALDSAKWLRHRGIVASATLSSATHLRIVAAGASEPMRVLARARARLGRTLDRHLAGIRLLVIEALTLGERGSIPEDIEIAFRRSGVTHLLSVSGLHMAAIVLLAYTAMRRLLAACAPLCLFVSTRAVAALLALPLTAVYALLCGGAVPVVRSALVAGALLLAAILRRRVDGPSSLALAALCLLAFEPVLIEQPAFQLSFVACVGLLLAPRSSRSGPIGWVLNLATATLGASLATAPLSAWHFGQVSVAGVLANFICVPLTTLFVLPASLVGLLLGELWPWGGGVTLTLAGHGVAILVEVARVFSLAPLAAIQTGCPTLAEMILCGAAIAFLLLAKFRWGILALVLLCALISVDMLARRSRDGVRVTFVDVGQGDAILVELPGGRNMLVDGGGSFDGGPGIGRAALLPFLRKRRVLDIDTIVLSHPHPDHFGGLLAVLDELPVGELWTSGEPSAHPAYLRLLEALERHAVPRVTPRALSIGDTRLEVLHPLPSYAEALSTNDNSLALRVSVGSRSLLLPGDLEVDGETILAAESPVADVLKVPHHGSRTSSSDTLLEAVRPKWAVASLGFANRYGFPHPEVVQRYADHSIPLLRTDRDGAVVVRLTRSSAWVETYERGVVARW